MSKKIHPPRNFDERMKRPHEYTAHCDEHDTYRVACWGCGLPKNDPIHMTDERTVTVCAACLTASCWQYVFLCDKHKTAGTVQKTVAELRALGREHHSYWKSDEEVAYGIKRAPIAETIS